MTTLSATLILLCIAPAVVMLLLLAYSLMVVAGEADDADRARYEMETEK